MTGNEMKTLLKLEPHPVEGGAYRRTYASAGKVEMPRGLLVDELHERLGIPRA